MPTNRYATAYIKIVMAIVIIILIRVMLFLHIELNPIIFPANN